MSATDRHELGKAALRAFTEISPPWPDHSGTGLYALTKEAAFGGKMLVEDAWKLRLKLIRCATPAVAVPSHRKSVSALMLGGMWASAASILDRADNLIVIGYSLPDDDTHMHVLLRRWVTVRYEHGRRVRVIVVDPNAKFLSVRFRRLLGPRSKVIAVPKTFNRVTRGEIELNLLEPAADWKSFEQDDEIF